MILPYTRSSVCIVNASIKIRLGRTCCYSNETRLTYFEKVTIFHLNYTNSERLNIVYFADLIDKFYNVAIKFYFPYNWKVLS